MNTQQLECFMHVADKLNFTKAAEELYISTPAVTHHIKNLEEELNTALFIRNSKMVKLTEAGTFFYNDAREILEKISLAEKKVKKLASGNLAFLRIGCTSQVELDALEVPLKKLKQEFPSICPQIIVRDYFSLRSLFDNRQLDVLIGTKEMTAELRDCVFKKVRTVLSFVVLSEQSPLAGKPALCFEELSDLPLITLHPRFVPFRYGNRLQELITLHAQTHLHLLCEQEDSVVLLAKCGYGAAILPQFYIPASAGGIAVLPLTDAQSVIEYGVSYHKNLREKHIRQFIRYFAEENTEPEGSRT